MSDDNNSGKAKLGVYVSLRVIAGIAVAVACLWGGAKVIQFFTGGPDTKSQYRQTVDNNPTLQKMDVMLDNVILHEKPAAVEAPKKEPEVSTNDEKTKHAEDLKDVQPSASETTEKKESKHVETVKKTEVAPVSKADESHGKGHSEKSIKPIANPESDFGTQSTEYAEHIVRGSKFASAMIEQLNHEVNERTLSWRANDIFLFFTDNIENYQLGVLDVTRRTSEKLVERIARTSRAVTFDENLLKARALFNNDPHKYMFPDPENSYNEGIIEVKKYIERLNRGKATFHARADNLVPLLEAYEDLLGDCDERLVKRKERNGSIVSTFKADDYFHYSKGVSKSMAIILHAIMEDFGPVLDSRGGAADLEHAITELEHANHLDPWFVQESDLNGLFANHRANLAAYISHARSYIQYVIKTMTT